MNITTRPAVEADIPWLLQLRRTTMDAHLSASGAPASEADHMQRLLKRFDCAEVLLLDGQPAGLLKVARDGDCWEIVQIQLDPSLQGQGVGRRLLEQVIADARAAQAQLTLHVLTANPARKLYEQLGFSVTATEGHEYRMLLRP